MSEFSPASLARSKVGCGSADSAKRSFLGRATDKNVHRIFGHSLFPASKLKDRQQVGKVALSMRTETVCHWLCQCIRSRFTSVMQA